MVYLSSKESWDSLELTQPCNQCLTGAQFLLVKRPVRESNHLAQPSAEGNVECSYSFTTPQTHAGGRDGSVGIATRYGLDGPGIESRWRGDFPHRSRPAQGPIQPPVQWVPGLSRGGKRPGSGADHPPTPSAEAEEKVELYFYSPSAPSCPVLV